MDSRFEQLFVEATTQLAVTTSRVEDALRDNRALAELYRDLDKRLTRTEEATRIETAFGHREHEQLRERLKEGDILFKQLNAAAGAANRAAKEAAAAADSAQFHVKELKGQLAAAETTSSSRRWDLVQLGITTGVGAVGFLLAKGVEWLFTR